MPQSRYDGRRSEAEASRLASKAMQDKPPYPARALPSGTYASSSMEPLPPNKLPASGSRYGDMKLGRMNAAAFLDATHTSFSWLDNFIDLRGTAVLAQSLAQISRKPKR